MLDLKRQFLPHISFTMGVGTGAQGARADEAEGYAGHWMMNCGYDVSVPEVGTKGFDLIAGGQRIQVKQRTKKPKGSYVIDGLRPNVYAAGLVQEFMVFETLHPDHRLSKIYRVDAKHVYESGLLYFSAHNDRHQISKKRFATICAKHGEIISLNGD